VDPAGKAACSWLDQAGKSNRCRFAKLEVPAQKPVPAAAGVVKTFVFDGPADLFFELGSQFFVAV